jgi:hypothetical protein
MTIVQCAKAPDAKQLVNQVPMPYPLFSAGDAKIILTAESPAATARAKSTLNGQCCRHNEPQSGRD